jgi:hypothetical protein
LDLGQSIQNTREDIGVQCELGSEVYYKYSNLFENESGDESVHSAQLSEVHRTCCDVEKDALKSPSTEDECKYSYVLVKIKTLMKLFKNCNVCDLQIIEVKQLHRGCVLHVKYKCREGHCNKWSSCENPSKFVIRLSGGLLLNGINFVPIVNFAKTLNVLFLSNSTYYKTIKMNIAPVIIKDFWCKHKNEMYEEARAQEEVWITDDGQYDSPGFSAKYVIYYIMDMKTKKILDFVLFQRGMVDGDLEKAACEKVLN